MRYIYIWYPRDNGLKFMTALCYIIPPDELSNWMNMSILSSESSTCFAVMHTSINFFIPTCSLHSFIIFRIWLSSETENTAKFSIMSSNSSGFRITGTSIVWVNCCRSPKSCKVVPFEVVAITSSFFPRGGSSLRRVAMVWRTAVLNRGPIGTYSIKDSMLSIITQLNSDL